MNVVVVAIVIVVVLVVTAAVVWSSDLMGGSSRRSYHRGVWRVGQGRAGRVPRWEVSGVRICELDGRSTITPHTRTGRPSITKPKPHKHARAC